MAPFCEANFFRVGFETSETLCHHHLCKWLEQLRTWADFLPPLLPSQDLCLPHENVPISSVLSASASSRYQMPVKINIEAPVQCQCWWSWKQFHTSCPSQLSWMGPILRKLQKAHLLAKKWKLVWWDHQILVQPLQGCLALLQGCLALLILQLLPGHSLCLSVPHIELGSTSAWWPSPAGTSSFSSWVVLLFSDKQLFYPIHTVIIAIQRDKTHHLNIIVD